MNLMFPKLTAGLLTVLLSLTALPGYSQDTDDEIKVQGFVDSYHAVRTAAPQQWMNSRTRIRLEMTKSFGQSSLFTSLNAVYNGVLKHQTALRLREAYLDYRGDNWSLRMGRQLIIWGNADGLRIMDVLSPMDLTEFLAQDYDDIRTPVNGLHLGFRKDAVRAELVLIPVVETFTLPLNDPANPWSFFPAGDQLTILPDEGPKPSLKNTEVGTRLSFALPGIDFSLSALYTWNKMALFERTINAGGIVIRPSYYRMGIIGADFSKPLGSFVLRGEGALNLSKHFLSTHGDHSVSGHSLNWLLGLDWYAPSEWFVSAQFSQENLLGKVEEIAQDRNTTLATLHVSKKLLDSTLILSAFNYLDITHRGYFSRLSSDYALNDQIHLLIGCDLLGGKEGMFSYFKKNSQLWVKAKYSF